jgi:hypothetical protein
VSIARIDPGAATGMATATAILSMVFLLLASTLIECELVRKKMIEEGVGSVTFVYVSCCS